jgi:hypothetical protein
MGTGVTIAPNHQNKTFDILFNQNLKFRLEGFTSQARGLGLDQLSNESLKRIS